MEEEEVQKHFSKGLKSLEKGESDHLCICGSYGQGKSHTLNHLNRLASAQGYATSVVQLDIREFPFHQFPLVYRAIMENLSLPGDKTFVEAWKQWNRPQALDLVPDMPHRFRMTLLFLQEHVQGPQKLREPVIDSKEASFWLEQVLTGHDLPLASLKSILHNREVGAYQDGSLLCRGYLPLMQMVQSVGKLLQQMGYKGLILFFDEAESITQGRINQRGKSYEILDHFFQTKASVYPIFAFTDDFFQTVNNEPYEQVKERGTLLHDYANRWKQLKIAQLKAFHSKEWGTSKRISLSSMDKPIKSLCKAKRCRGNSESCSIILKSKMFA